MDYYSFFNKLQKADSRIKFAKVDKKVLYDVADCVFATCNGDAIYTRDGKIYTRVHGSKHIVEEKLAESVEKLFEQVYDN